MNKKRKIITICLSVVLLIACILLAVCFIERNGVRLSFLFSYHKNINQQDAERKAQQKLNAESKQESGQQSDE